MSDPSDGDIGELFEPDEEEEESMGPDDPAAEYGEGTLGPETPHPSIPQAPEPGSDAVRDYEDVDPTLRRRFWALVFAIKLTVIAVTLGSLLIAFEGNVSLGSQVLAAAVVLSGYSVYRYRLVKAVLDGDDTADSVDESDVEADEAEPDAADLGEVES